jgi:hypothetical protein
MKQMEKEINEKEQKQTGRESCKQRNNETAQKVRKQMNDILHQGHNHCLY